MNLPKIEAIDRMLERFDRVRRDPSRLVHYLRQPRRLVVGGPIINALGLQAARAVKERIAWGMRPAIAPEHLRAHLETLDRDGFVVIENFYPAEEFARLEQELEAIEAQPEERFWTVPFGENFLGRVFTVSGFPAEYPQFARLVRDNDYIYDLARAVARRGASYRPNVILQWVFKPEQDKPYRDFEYNSYLHVDRHYPFLKAFLYLRDVPADGAPYTYVRGSHRFNWDRLRFEYLLGVHQSRARKGKAGAELYTPEQKANDRGMFRLAEELRDRGNLEEVPIVAKKNTMIISNNQGLHRRGEMGNRPGRVTANIDFKFLESLAHRLYPVLGKLAQS